MTGTGSLVVAVGARGAGQRFEPAAGPARFSAEAPALGLRTRRPSPPTRRQGRDPAGRPRSEAPVAACREERA